MCLSDLEKESVLYAPSGLVGVTVCDLCLRNQICAGCDQYTPTRNPTASVKHVDSSALSFSIRSLVVSALVVFTVVVRAMVD